MKDRSHWKNVNLHHLLRLSIVDSGDNPQNTIEIRVIIQLSDNPDSQYVRHSPDALSQWDDHAEISTRGLSCAYVAGRREAA